MDLTKIEGKWQKRWAKEKVFEPKRAGKKFYFTVPFPYTSGPLHVGHGRTFTTGDFIARFKRKQGYNVLFPMGFHISGTPILSISDRINKGEKAYIDLFKHYVSLYEGDPKKVENVMESFKKPSSVANYFGSVIEQDFKSIGLSIDWTRQFKTGDKAYNKFIEWQYAQLKKGGALSQGSHPVTYCIQCANAVGEDDIKDGDSDKVSINEFTAIKFKLGDKYLVASTLRPETIYGITNLWVNPEVTYVEAERDGEVIIISKESLSKLECQGVVKKLREFPGTELIGKNVTTPIISKQVLVLPSDFVDADRASGVVYSVPAHAPFDYVALKELQENEQEMKKYGLNVKDVRAIKPITIINIQGYSKEPAIQAVKTVGVKSLKDHELIEQATKSVYKDEFYKGVLNEKCGKFAGLKINDIKDQVINKMKKQGDAFTFYETSRKAICRCTGKVIIALLNNQWFLDYTSKEWKSKTRGLINDMTIIDSKYRKSFIDTLEWLEKRPCARRRGLGTKLPYDKDWVIESLSDSTIYMAYYTISQIIKQEKLKPEQLTPEVFDYVFLGKGKAPAKWAEEMRREFTYWYPNDHRHTAPAHISNHLTFFLFHHTKIFPKKYWPKAMSFNGMLIREGAKMSKSKGNVIPLIDIARKYSADLFRMFVLSTSDMDSMVDWRENEVSSVKKKLERFANLALRAAESKPASKLEIIDEWLISRFYSRLIKSREQGDALEIRDYCINLFFEFLNELSHYAKRVSIDQFNRVVRVILPDWLKALEPVIPHVCEEVWSKIGIGYISLKEFEKINESKIKPIVEANESLVINTVTDVNEVLKLVKGESSKINVFVADDWKYDLMNIVKKYYIKGFKVVIGKAMSKTVIKAHAKEANKLIQSLLKNPARIPNIITDRESEYQSLSQAIKFLENEFGLEVDVSKESNPKALPSKPGILIE